MDDDVCFWCGMRPGTPAQPGKIPLCPDCQAEFEPKMAAVTAEPDDAAGAFPLIEMAARPSRQRDGVRNQPR